MMKTHVDKTSGNTSYSGTNSGHKKQNNGKSTFQFTDNRPEVFEHRKLQQMANNSISPHVQKFQLMAKEKEGSAKYNSLREQKETIDDKLAKMDTKTEDDRKDQALKELMDLKDSQLRKYGYSESYTPYYKDESKPQELRTAWRMCEDERMGKESLHVHQTKQEIEAFVTNRAVRIREKEGKDAYNLKQESTKTAQL